MRYVEMRSRPRVQRKLWRGTNVVLANAVPKLRRHSEQWQQTMRRGELVASYAMVPHKQLPLTRSLPLVDGNCSGGGTGKSSPGG
jgi:hypothetical protein